METAVFQRLRRVVYEKSGIWLRDGKEAMAAARVAKRMRSLHIDGYASYLRYLLNDDTGKEVVHLLDAISTNVTSFFREPEHFDFLGRAVQKWVAEGQTRLRVWSAACATGQEPYSIAMTLLDAVPGPGVDLRVLGTDISTQALETAARGVYEKDDIKNVPAGMRYRYLDTRRQEGKTYFVIREIARQRVLFKRLNLSVVPFPMRGPLDAIFCRNVLFYLDHDVVTRLLSEIRRLLKPGGYLMAGHAESMTCMMSGLRLVKPSIYVKEG